MAPIKLEENIREKLQERELQPSKDAWDKLEARLAEKDEKTNNKTLWFSIAAGIAAILIVGSLIFKPSEDIPNEVVIEKNTPEKNTTQKKPEFIPQEMNREEVAVEEVISEKPIKTEALQPQKEKKSGINEQKNTDTDAISIVEIQEIKGQSIEANTKINEEVSFLNSKVEEVVARVKELEKTKMTITPEEVDALLAKAQLEIQTRRILNESSQKVDAAALLMDVEQELERSFRDKVFEALGDGYKVIHTAISERNN